MNSGIKAWQQVCSSLTHPTVPNSVIYHCLKLDDTVEIWYSFGITEPNKYPCPLGDYSAVRIWTEIAGKVNINE